MFTAIKFNQTAQNKTKNRMCEELCVAGDEPDSGVSRRIGRKVRTWNSIGENKAPAKCNSKLSQGALADESDDVRGYTFSTASRNVVMLRPCWASLVTPHRNEERMDLKFQT